jgi:hypothetical protein
MRASFPARNPFEPADEGCSEKLSVESIVSWRNQASDAWILVRECSPLQTESRKGQSGEGQPAHSFNPDIAIPLTNHLCPNTKRTRIGNTLSTEPAMSMSYRVVITPD